VQAPVVTGVSPSRASTIGGTILRVQGLGFGGSDGDIVSVQVGGRPCLNLDMRGDREIRCSLPAGVGARLSVEVVNAVGLRSSEARVFSYNAPVLNTVTPPTALTAPDNTTRLNVLLEGESIASGNRSDDAPVILVGGVSCTQIMVISTSTVRCIGLDASAWTSGRVSLELGGQTATS